MKKWEHGTFEGVISERLGGNLYDWPEVAEALASNGISLPFGTPMRAVREICRLILAERKTTFLHIPPNKELQEALLDREIYVSANDIAETYSDYCEAWRSLHWAPLSAWDGVDHIGPVDYIAARIGNGKPN
jgi:hypothetical protein